MQRFVVLIVLLSVVVSHALSDSRFGDCYFQTNVDSFPVPEPLILKPGVFTGYKEAFYLPEDLDGTVNFAIGDQIRLACPGPDNFLNVNSQVESVVTCVAGNLFQLSDGTSYPFLNFTCAKYPYHYTKTVGTCYNNAGILIEVGFFVNENEFFSLDTICFDENLLTTIYSLEHLPWETIGHQHGVPRPYFLQGDFYGSLDVNDLYTFDTQFATFSTLLGGASQAGLFFQQDDIHYLARGHLAPRGDYIYGAHTRASFYFINVAPQYQGFNEDAWADIENATREFVIAKRSDFDVYTGPYGVLSHPNVEGIQTPLYLVLDANNNGIGIPVPKLYYKVVYEPSTRLGVVFLGVNNMFVEYPLPADYRICNDVCSSITWIPQARDIYCCTVDEFRSVFSGLPDFPVDALLTA